MNAFLNKPVLALGVSMSLLLCLASGPRVVAAEKVSARTLPKAAAHSASVVSNTVVEVEVPLSVFVDRPDAHDPFFPNASYRVRKETRPTTSAQPNGNTVLGALKLNGFGGVGSQRWAMVNGVSIYKDESSSVRIGNKTYQIVCLEMTDQSVVVGIKGDSARRELKLDN